MVASLGENSVGTAIAVTAAADHCWNGSVAVYGASFDGAYGSYTTFFSLLAECLANAVRPEA